MGTPAMVYINGELLCYTQYDGSFSHLGENLHHISPDWRKILRICKPYEIFIVSLKFWLKDPELVYNCFPKDKKVGFHDSFKELLNPKTQEELEEDNFDYEKIEDYEFVFAPFNELYDITFYMDEDYQYNVTKNEIFIRLGYKNFPWVPFEDLNHFNYDEFLYNILLDMAGVIELSDIKAKLVSKLHQDGPVSSGRHFILACKKATQYLPNDPNSWWNYGVSLELAGKLEEAINMYEKSKELTPMNPIIHRILGEKYLKTSQDSEVFDSVKNSIKYLADIKEMKKLDKEIIILLNLITETKEFRELYNLLYENLIDIYKNLEIFTPNSKIEIWRKIGSAYHKIGKEQEALEAFKKCIVILKGFYKKGKLEREKKSLIDVVKNTKFTKLCGEIEEITVKKEELI